MTRHAAWVDGFRRNAAGIAVALLAGGAGVAGSYAAAGFTAGFVAAPIANEMAKLMPGAVVTVAILVLGDLGQKLNLLSAVGMAAVMFAAAAAVGVVVERRRDSTAAGALAAAGGSAGVALLLTRSPVPAAAAGLATGVVLAGSRFALVGGRPGVDPGTADRRAALKGLAVAGGIGLFGGVVGGSRRTDPPETGSSPEADASVQALLDDAETKSLDVDGMEPLVSENFYTVDIATVNPTVRADEWELSVTGAVNEEHTVDYGTITDMASEHRFVTLRCVGERLNGKKMDNALWTGVPMSALLSEVSPESGCECVMLRAADDYFEEFPLSALKRGFLAYGMNGRALPRAHGYPVRALIPGHWGEINVKWLTGIEFLDRTAKGYWEQRGWHGTGPVNTVAKLHARNRLDDGRLQVGGHAYAGLRGVSAVEVSTDGGDTWHQARLSDPLPGQDIWRQWAYEYQPPGGSHTVVVRAVEADGTVQPKERTEAFPSGATGWVSKELP